MWTNRCPLLLFIINDLKYGKVWYKNKSMVKYGKVW